VEEVKEIQVRRYITELQSRGKYTFTSNIRSRDINHPDRRTDYGHKITNITINNYLRKGRETGPHADHEGRYACCIPALSGVCGEADERQ